MEVFVRVEESEQRSVEVNAKPGSEEAFRKQVADPVVYKLVRVVDGKLVPATDDELMEVENLLGSEKSKLISVTDVLETVRHSLDNKDSYDKSLPEQHRGSSQSRVAEGDEVKMELHDEKPFPAYAPGSISRHLDQSLNNMEESGLQDGFQKSESADNRPNFSLLKGEINLNKLTIRELQETFRATFGRETSVKDKVWLKRRIAMGLSNSCAVAGTSFVINDGKVLNKVDEPHNSMPCEDSVSGEAFGAGDQIPVSSANHPEDDVAFRSFKTDSGCRSDDCPESRAAKRVRKPTKRYIEELSDKETTDPNGKPISPSDHHVQEKSSLSLAVRPGWTFHSGATVTRPDSIGGSGVQVPYVSRIRRCRPRQSVMTLTKFESSDVALPTRTVLILSTMNKPQLDTHSKAMPLGIRAVPFEDPISSKNLMEKQTLTSKSSMSDSSQDREPKDVDSGDYVSQDKTTGVSSDDNLATVPTANGGMRRKHHRAWSLAEVVKLVDGVSRFGAGRWSEIKRLSFSSYSHRTAVDLKDKWRNLLKASFSNVPADKGASSRKSNPLLIPTPILLKVRELAELNGQAPQILKVIKDDGNPSVNKN